MSNPILRDWTVPPRPANPRPPGAGLTRLKLVGEITVESALPLFRAIEAAGGDTIEIQIDSGGGNALCALALFELLITHPHRVVADITGRASSGAAIAAAGADHRRIAPGARIMLHQSRASVADVTADELRPIVSELDTVDRLVAAIFSQATGRTPECVAAWEQASTTFDASAAIAAGLAHDLVGSGGA